MATHLGYFVAKLYVFTGLSQMQCESPASMWQELNIDLVIKV